MLKFLRTILFFSIAVCLLPPQAAMAAEGQKGNLVNATCCPGRHGQAVGQPHLLHESRAPFAYRQMQADLKPLPKGKVSFDECARSRSYVLAV